MQHHWSYQTLNFQIMKRTGICQPRGYFQAFDMHAVSYKNVTSQRILLEKQAHWLICQGQEKIEESCKGTFLILYMHFFLLLIKPELHSEIRNHSCIDVNQHFFAKLNQISVDIIWRTPFHIYKTIRHNISWSIILQQILKPYHKMVLCGMKSIEMIKMHYLTVLSIKMLQCWQGTGHLSAFWVPTPGNLPPKVKKIANVQGSAQRRGGGGGRVGAAGIDCCHGITATNCHGRYIIIIMRWKPMVSPRSEFAPN